VQSISLTEGLYNLDLLLTTWPSYHSFVQPAFGQNLTEFHTLSPSNYPLRIDTAHIRWFIVHSTGDDLVDLPQSSTMYQHLLDLGANVSKDWTSLHGKHDEILSTETYVRIIAQHILSSIQ
jgi:dipeptidyl aminopeptidase/acylaminoacyl peptidase